MMWRLAFIAVFFHLAICQHPHNHGEVMHDINDLHMHYNDALCHEIIILRCHGHNAVCGSDNMEYVNHCEFAKARCRDSSLSLLGEGHCHELTTEEVTTMISPAVGGVSSHTQGHHTGTTMMPQPTTMMTVTADPVFVLIKDVFCGHTSEISCLSTPESDMCGSDGEIYKNQCMFSKIKCFKPDLEVAPDPSLCGMTTPAQP